MIFSFGQSENERVEIDVLRYERPLVGEYWDDNWLRVEIRVQAGGVRGKVTVAILTGELEKLLSELRPLYKTLSGSVNFKTMEAQLTLVLVGDGKGHIELRGEILDQPGIGNRLNFVLQFDQTQLATSIRELERVMAQFPIRSLNASDAPKK
jgi:hypothetical protein